MPKFIVEVCYRTVEEQWATMEVDAISKSEAELLAEVAAGCDQLDWGKEEITGGEYIFHTRLVVGE